MHISFLKRVHIHHIRSDKFCSCNFVSFNRHPSSVIQRAAEIEVVVVVGSGYVVALSAYSAAGNGGRARRFLLISSSRTTDKRVLAEGCAAVAAR